MGVSSPGTIEEKIYQRQISKQGLSGAVVDLTRSSEHIQFSVEELKDLFTLHEDSPCVTHDLLGCECAGGKDPTGELCWFPQAARLSLETFKGGLQRAAYASTGFLSLGLGGSCYRSVQKNFVLLAFLSLTLL